MEAIDSMEKNAQDMASEVFPYGIDMWLGKDRMDLAKWQSLVDVYGYDSVKAECMKRKGRLFASDVMEIMTKEDNSASSTALGNQPWYNSMAHEDKELADDVLLCLRYCYAHGVSASTFENIVFYINIGYPPKRLSSVVRSSGYGGCGAKAGTKAGRRAILNSRAALNNDERKYRDEQRKQQQEKSVGQPGPNCPW